MVDVPVVIHLAQLVTDLASRSEAEHDACEDDGQESCDETPNKVI